MLLFNMLFFSTRSIWIWIISQFLIFQVVWCTPLQCEEPGTSRCSTHFNNSTIASWYSYFTCAQSQQMFFGLLPYCWLWVSGNQNSSFIIVMYYHIMNAHCHLINKKNCLNIQLHSKKLSEWSQYWMIFLLLNLWHLIN